jgi:hypothetical protein
MPEEVVVEGPQKEEKLGEEKPSEHPETVSWTQYVGLKEKFNKVESELKEKVRGLEEQVKNSVTLEEHTKAKAELEKVSGELKAMQNKSLEEKRGILKGKVPDEEIAEMSEKELDTVIKVLRISKPAPDLSGGGGGSGGLTGTPMDLARRAYESKK